MVLKGYLFSVLYAVLCLAFAFVLYKLGVPKKITRKIVHILIGAEWIILYHFFGGGIHFLLVCLLFLGLLTVSYWKKLMPMISSDGDNSPGTVYYGVAMTIMATVTVFEPDMIIPFGIGVFCTSLGDGFAGLIGQAVTSKWNYKLFGKKSIVGTLVNLTACFLAVFAISDLFALPLNVSHCIAVALLVTELELFTGKGLDNITITLGASFLSYFFIYFEGAENYIVPILLTPLIIAFAYKKKALTVGGIVAAIVLDILISVAFGNFGFCILLSFFIGGVVVDKIKKNYKKSRQNSKNPIEKRGECRDHVQVFANGSVAAACAVFYLVTLNNIFVIAFVGAMAEAFADTAASGIGVINGRAFDPFRMRRCTPGISGGMSLLGTGASLFAAMVIAFIAFVFGAIDFADLPLIIVAAFLGAIFDSMLGSLLQIKYRCQKCGAIVEREEHCNRKTVRHSGIKFITNDTVNFLGTAFSAVVCFVYYIINNAA